MRGEYSLAVMAGVSLVTVLAFLIWAIGDILVLIFAGLLVAILLRSFADALRRLLPIRAGGALALVLILLVGGLLLFGEILGAEFIGQLDEFLPGLQKAWEDVRHEAQRYDVGRALLASLDFTALVRDRAWMARITGGLFSSTIGAVASLLIIVFIGIYAAAAPETYREGLLRLIPPWWRPRAQEVLTAIGSTMRWWLIGTFVRMMAVGMATTIGLILLDMPLALALGAIAFLFEFIPYAGPVLAALPALVVGLAVGPMQMAYVGVLYLVIQTIENYVVSPLIDQRSVHLPPVLAIVAQLLLAASPLGLLGAFFATPLMAVAIVLVQLLYIEDCLGEGGNLPGRRSLG